MADNSQIIAFLEDETYNNIYDTVQDPLGSERFFVYASVRGLIDDYYRAFAQVGKGIVTTNRKLYVEAYASLGHNPKYVGPFTVALLRAKSKGFAFNWEPKSESEETGGGEVSYTNKLLHTGKDIVKKGSELPGAFIDAYKLIPYVGVAILAYIAISYIPTKK